MGDEIEKMYWPAQEVADQLNITLPALYSWCKIFKIKPKKAKHRNKLMLSKSNIDRLKLIYIYMYVEQYTIKGIHLKLKTYET